MSKRSAHSPGHLPAELQDLIFHSFTSAALHYDDEYIKRLGTMRLLNKHSAVHFRRSHSLGTLGKMHSRRADWRLTLEHPVLKLLVRVTEEQDENTWSLFLELISNTEAPNVYKALKLVAQRHAEEAQRIARLQERLPALPPIVDGMLWGCYDTVNKVWEEFGK